MVMGLGSVGLGAYAYLGANPSQFVLLRFGNPRSQAAFVVSLVPDGVGLALAGIALTIGHGVVARVLLPLSLPCLVIGITAAILRPRWMQPKWLRDGYLTLAERGGRAT
jgi:hypothetical protein